MMDAGPEDDRETGVGDRIIFFLALLAGFGIGCVGSEERSPIPDSTMVDVLIELHLSAARAEITNEVPVNIRDSILIAYDLDSTTYARTITYYAEHPDKYGEIYSRVLDRLNSERIPLGYAPSSETAASPSPPTRSPQ